MDRLIDAFAKWPPIGQGIFVLIILSVLISALISAIVAPFRYLAVCVRGWPPPRPLEDDDDDGQSQEN